MKSPAAERLEDAGVVVRFGRLHRSRLLGLDWMLTWTVLDRDRPVTRWLPRKSARRSLTPRSRAVYWSWLRMGAGVVWGQHPSRDGEPTRARG